MAKKRRCETMLKLITLKTVMRDVYQVFTKRKEQLLLI